MANFDSRVEAESLATMMEAGEWSVTLEGGNLSATKIFDEVTKEFCRLSPEQRQSTADVLKDLPKLELLRNGQSEAFGLVSSRIINGEPRGFASLNCETGR